MPDLKTYAIGSLSIILLVSLGFNIPEDATHFCRNSSLPKNCARISTTGKTCYPNQGNNLGSKLCASVWENLTKNIQSESSIQINENGKNWICSCGKINSYTTCKSTEGTSSYIGELI